MNKDNFQELAKICSNNSILVINKIGIYRLFCPFKVVCLNRIELYSVGQEVVVIAVKMDVNYKLIYLIENKAYYHHHFLIVSKPQAAVTSFN